MPSPSATTSGNFRSSTRAISTWRARPPMRSKAARRSEVTGINAASYYVARRVLCPRLRSVLELPAMVRASTWALCLTAASCAASRHEWEPAGSGASLLPRDQSLEQVFQTDDEAAKAACDWLRNNEPKARDFEYCGFILLVPGG